MLTTSLSQSKFTYSSRHNPCPVCGRVKDGDCRRAGELLHCRTYAKACLEKGAVVQGSDGQRWVYLGRSGNGLWALFKPHQEKRDSWTPKLIPSAKQTPKPVSTPSTTKKPRPKGEHHYVYHDVDGHPLLKVVREDDGKGNKDIHQFRWENGNWVARLTEQVTRRVRLYRIHDARTLSQKTSLPIFMVEGESCVERLLELGIPATTSLGGSGKWTKYGYPNYLQDLSSFRVILCPDADVPGLDHMLKIEKSLRTAGIKIAGWLLAPPDAPWDNLPKGGGLDVVDWLENGATTEDILSSIRVSLPAHLVVDDEHADLAEEVSELAQLDRASGITLLPNRLDISLRRLAENLVLPTEAYWLPLLCTAASLISSQTRLMINRYSEFSVPPVLWGGLVGEPGSGKSHILNVLTKPLKDIQAEHFTRYQHRLEEYQAALRDWERRRKNEDAGDMPKRPKPTSLYASNYTLEAIGQTLGNQPDRGLLINPDELAVFLQSMDAYRGGKGADRAHWLSLYNGDALKVDRKNSDQVFVRHTSVSVVGGIQPSVLQNLWREDKNIDDGLWSRFAWVQIPLTPTPYIEEEFLSSPCKLLERVYRRLLELPPQEHELDDEARKLWKKWNQEVDELLLSEPNERIRTTLPKTKERAARIALILHYLDAACAEDKVIPSKLIPASTLLRAIEFTRWLHDQSKLLCGELGESATPEAGLAHRFLKRFQGCGSVSLRQARNWWPGRRKPSSSEIRTFLDGLVQLGYARWVDPNHVELLQPCSGSPVVHKEPESLAQSDFEQWTTASSTRSPSSSTAVTPADSGKSIQSEPSPSLQRKEAPKQTSFPPDSSASRGFKPKNPGKPPALPSTNGIPPWQWEG